MILSMPELTQYRNALDGWHVGIVKDNLDPLYRGAIKVDIPGIFPDAPALTAADIEIVVNNDPLAPNQPNQGGPDIYQSDDDGPFSRVPETWWLTATIADPTFFTVTKLSDPLASYEDAEAEVVYDNGVIQFKIDNSSPAVAGDKMLIVVIEIPNPETTVTLPWVFPLKSAFLGGSQSNSNQFVPEVGSEVLIQFPQQDVYSGFYFGYSEGAIRDNPALNENTDKGESYPEVWGFQDSGGLILQVMKALGKLIFNSHGDAIVEIDEEGSVKIVVPKDLDITVGGNVLRQITGDRDTTIGGHDHEKTGTTHQHEVVGTQTEKVGGNKIQQVVGNQIQEVDGTRHVKTTGAEKRSNASSVTVTMASRSIVVVGVDALGAGSRTAAITGSDQCGAASRTENVTGADSLTAGSRTKNVGADHLLAANGAHISATDVHIEGDIHRSSGGDNSPTTATAPSGSGPSAPSAPSLTPAGDPGTPTTPVPPAALVTY